MTKSGRFYIFILFLILSLDVVKAQEDSKFSLSPKFEHIQRQIYTPNNRAEAYSLSKKFIVSAKAEGTLYDLFCAYSSVSDFAPDSLALKYSDSILNIAIKLKDPKSIGMSYSSIAGRSLRIFDYKKAAEFCVISYDYYTSQKSDDLANQTLLAIAKLKSVIDEDENAKNLIEGNHLNYKKNQTDPLYRFWYNNYRIVLISINTKLKKFNENRSLIKEAYQFYEQNKEYDFFKFHILYVDGCNDFSLGKYDVALAKLLKSRKAVDLVDSQNLDNIDFYIAMCYWKKGQTKKAFPIFEKIKQNYFKTKKTSLAFRPAFDFYTEYYKKNGTIEQQLASMNDLLEFDKYEKDVRKYVQVKLKEFDEKHQVEEENNLLEEQTTSDIIGYTIIILSSLSLIYYVIRKLKSNKKTVVKDLSEVQKFNDNKITTENLQPKTIESFSEDEIDYSLYRPINKLTVDQIITAMNTFESSLGFLEQDLKLTSLAQKFSTNDKYLSKVIKIKTGKTFNAYLTDLRFEYLDRMLQKNSQFRNQKIKEISAKLGFGSPEFFATAFKEKYGTSPKEFFVSN